MICPACGFESEGNSAFCPECGARIAPVPSTPDSAPAKASFAYNSDSGASDTIDAPVPSVGSGDPNLPPPPESSKENKKPPKKRTFGQVLLSIILCILLIAAALIPAVTYSVRSYLEADIPQTFMEEYDGEELAEAIFEDADDATGIGEYIGDKRVHAYLSDSVEPYVDYFLYGKKLRDTFGRESLTDFLAENDEQIFDSTGFTTYIVEDDVRIDELDEDRLDALFDDLGFEELDTDTLKSILGVSPSLITFVLSNFSIILQIVFAAVLFILIFVVNRWRKASFRSSGIALLISGILLVLCPAVGIAAILFTGNSVFSPLVNPLFFKLMLIGAAMFAAGVLLLLLGKLFFHKKKEPVTQPQTV